MTILSNINAGISIKKVREFFNEGKKIIYQLVLYKILLDSKNVICNVYLYFISDTFVWEFEIKTRASRPISLMMHLNTTTRFEKEKVEKGKKDGWKKRKMSYKQKKNYSYVCI